GRTTRSARFARDPVCGPAPTAAMTKNPLILPSARAPGRGDLARAPAGRQTGGHGERRSERGAAMTTGNAGPAQWSVVDEGWGRAAADFAALSEPSNCREYVTMHHRLGVDAGDRLLDVACGSGVALELGRPRGAAP